MNTIHSRRALPVIFCAILTLAATGATAVSTPAAATAASSSGTPIVNIDGGQVRGVAVPGGYAFRGLPYAAAPIGQMRWRAPEPPAAWNGVRDATEFAPICPQPDRPYTIDVKDEDCLYLNVSTPELGNAPGGGRSVLVWIHGGGATTGAARMTTPQS